MQHSKLKGLFLYLLVVPSLCMSSLSQSAHRQTHRHCNPHRQNPLHQHPDSCTPVNIYQLMLTNILWHADFLDFVLGYAHVLLERLSVLVCFTVHQSSTGHRDT